jgi:hypothetical protein
LTFSILILNIIGSFQLRVYSVDGMLIEHEAQTYANPVRGDMFIDHATPEIVEPRRGGMIERMSSHGDRANTTNPNRR